MLCKKGNRPPFKGRFCMKKIAIVLTVIFLLLSLVSCTGGDEGEEAPDIPPGFTVLQKQQKMTKHSEKGENPSFSKEEFQSFLGEELGCITVTTLPENGTLVCNGSAVLKGQTLSAEELEFMKFIPNEECDAAFFNFTCDSKGYYGKEMSCDMVFTDGINTPPVASDGSMKTVEGISCYGKLSIREPNGDDYRVKVITYPSDGYVSVSEKGDIVYTPEEGFCGSDKLVYSVTDCFGAVSETATLKIQVEENKSGICFADMANDPLHLQAHKMCEENVMVYRFENGQYYFDPDQPVSKMEFLVMAMCVSGLDREVTAVADSVADDDTGLSSGLKGYLSKAYDCGLIKLENGKFLPKESITVAGAAYMAAKALDLPGIESDLVSADGENKVYDAVAAAVNAGILDIESVNADPTAILTKKDAAGLLCRMVEYMEDNNIQK